MAVLEKIRKRSVLLFIIIIGALLAFILGDFLNSGRSLFGPGDTVAQVDNVKVKQLDLNSQSEKLENYVKNARANGQSLSPDFADADYRYQQALDAALYEKLMQQECSRLGINVTDDFISKFVSDPNSTMYVWQTLFSQMGGNPQETMAYLQQNGIVDPVTYLDAIKNPARYKLDDATVEVLTAAWQSMENNLAQQAQFNIYNNMLNSMTQINKADAKAYFDNQNTLATVKSVSLPISTVKDDEVTIEDADLQAVYDINKDSYKILEENRELAYIVVPIQASAEDFTAAETATRSLIADLNLTEGVQALSDHKGFMHKTVKLTDNDIAGNLQYAALKSDSTGMNKGMVKELFAPRGSKVVAKVLDVTTGIDNVVYAFFPVRDENQADSLFTEKSFAAVDSVINAQTGGQLSNLKTSLINPDLEGYAGYFTTLPVVADAIATAPLNQYYFVNDTVSAQPMNGVLIVKERDAAVPVYEVALMSYDVFPSEQTRRQLTQDLHNYVANHPTAEQFANDTTGMYNVRYSLVSPNQFTIANSQNTPNTRALVKWALEAKKGAVSPVYTRQRTIYGRGDQPDESQDYLIAVAVMDVYDDYIPASSHLLQDGLKNKATSNKKAQVLVDKYAGKGKNADEYAKAMGAAAQPMNVAFGAGTIGGAAQGQLAAAKKGDVVGPVQGANAVYVFQVDEVSTPDFGATDLQTRMNEATRGFRTPRPGLEMLIGNRKVKNNSLKYFTASPSAE